MADWNSDNITLRPKEIHLRSHEFGTDVTNEGADEDVVTDDEDDDEVGTDDVVVVDEVVVGDRASSASVDVGFSVGVEPSDELAEKDPSPPASTETVHGDEATHDPSSEL